MPAFSDAAAPAAAGRRKNPHVAMCVLNAKGHIHPAMMLVKKLASLGLSVTVIFPDRSSHGLLTGGGGAAAARDPTEGLDILLTVLDVPGDDGRPPPSPKTVMKGVRRAVYAGGQGPPPVDDAAMQKALESKLREMMDSPSPLVAVIVDMLLSWTAPPLRKLGIPKYVLYTAAATHMAISRHATTLYEQGILPFVGDAPRPKEILVPGMPPLRWHDIPDYLRDRAHPFHSLTWDEHMFDAEGILMNTAYELEGKVIDAIRTEIPGAKGMPRIIPVGPLLPPSYFDDDARAGAVDKATVLHSPKAQECKCKAFLDSQLPSSVVYISFGSWAMLEEKQVYELAMALEASGHSFLWVLPMPAEPDFDYFSRVLPKDFEQRTKRRGLIVQDWAPQHLILSHPAIGGFITHCGWNSVLECISLAGAPLLGWPFTADQPVICRNLVEELKIAVEVEGVDRCLERDDIEKAVRRLMEGPEAEAMRNRATKLRSDLRRAVNESGSSYENLKGFVEEMVRKS